MMRLRAWNAFASNNSGSYTIVGRFADEGTASAVAQELAALVAEHAKWFEAHGYERWEAKDRSPLEQFAEANGLNTSRGAGRDDDWPQYGAPPEVLADGTQVVLHVDYTVTMPPLFGELMYRRGGRVDVELDHTHDPLVWVHEVWWPWQGRDEAVVKAGRVRLLDTLLGEGGPLRTQVTIHKPASWSDGGGVFGHADLSLAAVWNEPMVAIAQVRAMVASVGASARLRVMESMSPRDPAGMFRPCWPWPSENLVDVVLERMGEDPQAVLEQIAAVVLRYRSGHPGTTQAAASMVAQCPATLAWALPREVAEACTSELEQAGAVVRLVDHEYPERLVASPVD
jgi:hypothetical protein